MVRKSESELITIAGTMGNVENVDTLSKKELIIEIMKHGFSCMPTDMCNGYSEESNREKETESSSEGEEEEVECSDLSNEDCVDNPSCLLEGEGDDSVCIKAESDVAEPFGNLFNMDDLYRDRKTMIFIIIGGIIFGVFTATEAAAVAVVYALIITIFVYKEIRIKDSYWVGRW